MDGNRLLSSLCYFSIFFAGFIFPIIVYFISDSNEVKAHAKRALLSHLLPLITIPIIIMLAIFDGTGGFGVVIFGAIVIGGINIAVVIWNIVKGIQALKI